MTASTPPRMQLHYQPLADLQSGQLAGLEACIKVSPSAADSGMPMILTELDEAAMLAVFDDIKNWKDQGAPSVRVAIGVTLAQFRDAALAEKIGTALAGAGLDPKLIALQFTENHIQENPLSCETTLRQLKALGIELVLDRFGAGFGALRYLQQYPFDTIKVDPAFVHTVDSDSNTAAMTRAIIAMAHSIGLRVQAADVSDEAQCAFMCRNLCDEIQGALYGAPLSAAETVALLQQPPSLPPHLQRYQAPSRTLLLVDDEVNILASMKRLLRRDGYTILQASSGQEGLELLAQHKVDVIVSDQRMPGMTGVEFLREAKTLYPDTVRIVLSGYTELQSITDAINEGAIFKFLTKPWEDELLRGHIEGAFLHKEMANENARLQRQVQQASHEMAATNRKLEAVLQQQRLQLAQEEGSLSIVREMLQNMPLAVIGLDEDGIIVFVNGASERLFRHAGPLLGEEARRLMPALLQAIDQATPDAVATCEFDGTHYHVQSHAMGRDSLSRGRLLTLIPSAAAL